MSRSAEAMARRRAKRADWFEQAKATPPPATPKPTPLPPVTPPPKIEALPMPMPTTVDRTPVAPTAPEPPPPTAAPRGPRMVCPECCRAPASRRGDARCQRCRARVARPRDGGGWRRYADLEKFDRRWPW